MDIGKLRKQIDRVDGEILDLLNKRLKLAKQIGKIKKLNKEDIYAPNREKEILLTLIRKNKGPLPNDELKNIFREIIKTSLLLQKKLVIAYLGPEATFTQQAAIKNFGFQAQYLSCKSVADVFSAVEKSSADYGVVPIENATEGMVIYTLDMFLNSALKICAEVLIEVHHNLLSNGSLKTIEKVYSHPQAFRQCRIFLEENLPQVPLVEVESTARAARIAAEDNKSAAIAGAIAATIYDLNILIPNIEDKADNYTRFMVIGKKDSPRSNDDKTSILFALKDKVGALSEVLELFYKNNINLTKIESHPMTISQRAAEKTKQYVFFVDFLGHRDDAQIKKAVAELEQQCLFLKILGSYPVAEE